MLIFKKEREKLRIKKAAAARATFVNADVNEIEIKLKTEDNEILILELPLHVARALMRDTQIAYQAACPPLLTGFHQSEWMGMDDR